MAKKTVKRQTKQEENPETTPFEAGDSIVHPSYGPGRLIGITRQEVAGVERSYYNIELMHDKGTLMLPVKLAEDAGLRHAIENCEIIARILRLPPGELDGDHRKRHSDLEIMLNSGDAEQIAMVYRDLAWREKRGSLTERDQKLKMQAFRFIVSELSLGPDLDIDSATAYLDDLMNAALDKPEPPSPPEE